MALLIQIKKAPTAEHHNGLVLCNRWPPKWKLKMVEANSFILLAAMEYDFWDDKTCHHNPHFQVCCRKTRYFTYENDYNL